MTSGMRRYRGLAVAGFLLIYASSFVSLAQSGATWQVQPGTATEPVPVAANARLLPGSADGLFAEPVPAHTTISIPASLDGSSPQVSGLWFDPATAGQGFNLQVVEGGLFGFYYGYDDEDPLWLIFDVHPGPVVFGETMLVDARAPQQGVFGDPVSPDQGGVGLWGTLQLRFDSCTQAHARLEGLSGTQDFELMLLAGIDGVDMTNCTAAPASRPLADVTGAWFDPATAGQGWNFVQTPGGVVGFFYGYDQMGAPLWLTTEQVLQMELGVAQQFDLLSGRGGDFASPVPPDQLQRWGVVELELESCRNGVARLAGDDGEQEQPLQMLAGVPGLPECAVPVLHGWLNDTGIEFCGGAGSGLFDPCVADVPQGQDAHYGRDVLAALGLLDKVGGGNAGFDFTRISNSGEPLPDGADLGPGADDWACTRDNVTGLLWEIKVDDAAHRRHAEHGYTWYDPAASAGQQGVVGTTGTCNNSLDGAPCNIHGFVQAVRADGLCGRSDWRMPTRHELESIMDYSRIGPTIDRDYFPNTPSVLFWTGLPRVDSAAHAWAGFFNIGGIDYVPRNNANRVRLVSDSGVQR